MCSCDFGEREVGFGKNLTLTFERPEICDICKVILVNDPICTIHVFRILAFSSSAMKRVSVNIDMGQMEDCTHVSGPLYALAWKPKLYSKGVHYITVIAQV